MGVNASRFLRLTLPPMTGPDVFLLQTRLKEKGFYPGTLDGRFDDQTAVAVRAFQEAQGLTADAVVTPAVWSALGLGQLPNPISPETAMIALDTSQRLLSLHRGGQLVKSYHVAVGTEDTPTPLGMWIIAQKTENPGGPFGARWMRLSIPWGGYGIHGTDNPASIGTASSHGCVRLHNEDAIDLYNRVELGTPVCIIGRVFTGRLLQLGVQGGSDVVALQRTLQILGYYHGDLDGYFGPLTEEAVRSFQQDMGLTPDGIVGPRTYERLEAAHDTAVGWTAP